MAHFSPPKYVFNVISKLQAHGHEAYMTGGCVRDILMGKRPHDWDISTSAVTNEIIGIFPKTILTGAKYGTVTVLYSGGTAEVTTFRSEGAYISHRRPEKVEFVSNLEEDLKRRDFTINAMAMTLTGEIFDPMGGALGIKKGIIRCVGDPRNRFLEDALRMFRAFRFAAVTGFSIDRETYDAAAECAQFAQELSAERVRDETEKILMSPRPEMLVAAINLKLYSRYLSGADVCESAVPRIKKLPKSKMLRWAAFAACVAGDTSAQGELLRKLRLDKKTIRNVSAIDVKSRLDAEARDIKLTLSKYGEDAVLCAAAKSDVLYKGAAVRRVKEVIRSGECFSVDQLALTGEDLLRMGYAPGVQLGHVLKGLLEHVIENPEDNVRERLIEILG